MKRFRLHIAAAAAVCLAGIIASVAPAAAGTAPAHARSVAAVAAHVSTASQPQRAGNSVSPDSTCTRGGVEFTIWKSGCTDPAGYSCVYGNEGYMAYDPAYVTNGCGVRVWIYKTGVRAGYNLCISPGTGTGKLGQSYSYFWVSNNEDEC
jgi:hypothetical protein